MLEGAGGNIGVLIGNDGIIIIDDQFAAFTEKIKAALSKISSKRVKFVITYIRTGNQHSQKNY